MRVLNLYCGIGGNRKLWGDEHDITAIENNKEVAALYLSNFPNDTVIVADAHQYLLENYKDFDFIWSSPPCPTHSRMMKFTRHNLAKYIDLKLYQEIIFLKHWFNGRWVIENVEPYYDPLIAPTKKVGRHLFWSNFNIGNFEPPKFKGDKLKSYNGELEDYYGFKLPTKNIYFKGSNDQFKVLKNCVHPETGKYVLDCALGVIRKSNVKQTSIFDEET